MIRRGRNRSSNTMIETAAARRAWERIDAIPAGGGAEAGHRQDGVTLTRSDPGPYKFRLSLAVIDKRHSNSLGSLRARPMARLGIWPDRVQQHQATGTYLALCLSRRAYTVPAGFGSSPPRWMAATGRPYARSFGPGRSAITSEIALPRLMLLGLESAKS